MRNCVDVGWGVVNVWPDQINPRVCHLPPTLRVQMSGKFAARLTGGKQNDAGSEPLADPVSPAYGFLCATMGQKKLRRSGVSWVATGILAVLLAAPTLADVTVPRHRRRHPRHRRRAYPLARMLRAVRATPGWRLVAWLRGRPGAQRSGPRPQRERHGVLRVFLHECELFRGNGTQGFQGGRCCRGL